MDPMKRKARNMKNYRAANPEYVERSRKQGQARTEALSALARKHPAEYRELYEAECRHLGIWPPLPSGRKPGLANTEPFLWASRENC